MNFSQLATALVSLGISLLLGVIGYFLKRTIADVDKLRSICATREELSAALKELSEQRKDISAIKEDYITKEDFFREQAKTDRKLDRIMDILLEIKGGAKRGNEH